MEEEAVHMPVVDISFAPTKAFVGAFGEAEAKKQGERFVQPTWAQKVRLPQADAAPANPLLNREEAAQLEAQQVPPAAFAVVGGIFLAGAAFGLFVAWRMGALNTATFMSP